MSDIVERLRAFIIDFTVSAHHPQICTDAADEIERLRRERDAMRKALEFYRDEWSINADGDSETPGLFRSWIEPTDALMEDEGRKARSALSIPDERGGQ